jgi:hypothetical protein
MNRRATATKDKALGAFIGAKTEIDLMLARHAAPSARHFETRRDKIHRGTSAP